MDKLLQQIESPAFTLSKSGEIQALNDAFENDAALKQCQPQLVEHLLPYLNLPHKNLTCQFSVQRISLSLSQLTNDNVLVTCHRIPKRQTNIQTQQNGSEQSYFAILDENNVIVCSSHPDVKAQQEIKNEIAKIFDEDCIIKVSDFLDTLADDDFAEMEILCQGKKYLFSAEPLDLDDRSITLVSWQTSSTCFQPITGISQRYRYLLKAVNELSDGLIICDKFGQIVLLNNKVHKLFPYIKQKHYIGFPIEKFVEALLEQELKSHPERAESTLKWINKKQKSHQAISFSFQSSQGHFLEYRDRLTEQDERIGLLIDSTKTKELNDQLEQACRQTILDSEAKSQFMAVMGHEIRTPLNAIIGLLELSIAEQQGQHEDRSLQVAHRSAHHLLALLNDVLDFTRFESDKVALNQVPTDIRQLCEDVLITFAAQAQQHHFWLDLYVSPSVAKILICDDVRLTQILHNLIGNAIKFNTSEQPTALIMVETIADGASCQSLRISVLDNGIGISEAQQQRIFKGFMQASEETYRKFGGSGLGLSICQKICHLMNSELKVESQLGEGTHLYFDAEFTCQENQQAETFDILLDPSLSFYCNHPGFAHCLERYSEHYGFKVTYQPSPELVNVINPKAVLLIDFNQSDIPNNHHFHEHLSQMDQKRALLFDNQSATPRSNLPHLSLMPLKLNQIADLIGSQQAQQQALNSHAKSDNTTELWHIKLLIVEDNPDNIFVMKRQLESIGVQASFSEEPKEALKLFIQNEFDVVITDYQMPDLSGAELAFAMREHERQNKLTPSQIFVLTADRSEACAIACDHAEVDRMLAKPLSLNKLKDLLTQINTLFIQVDTNHSTHSNDTYEVDDLADHFKDRDDLFLDEFDDEDDDLIEETESATDQATESQVLSANTSQTHNQAVQESSTESSQDKNVCVDIEQIYQFTGEIDNETLMSVVNQFLENLISRRQSLAFAIQIDDFSQVHSISHTIKSSALYVGAKNLSKNCQALEKAASAEILDKETIASLWQDVETEFSRVIQFFESWKPRK